jgi:hypothetical protein
MCLGMRLLESFNVVSCRKYLYLIGKKIIITGVSEVLAAK